MTEILYSYDMPPANHWSFRIRRGNQIKLTDINGGANLGMLFYNPENLLERYNAPDTLKCQHTFKLTRGNCLYSDMGRIFCSIVDDSVGWHETVCGNSTKASIEKQWGSKNYQDARNEWQQNGWDSFLVELAKYGLNRKDLASNLNFFSKVMVDDTGNIALVDNHSPAGGNITLRFEMDTLVLMHNCPHPNNTQREYPRTPIRCEFTKAAAVGVDDYCKNFCAENLRGFSNNNLYYLGGE